MFWEIIKSLEELKPSLPARFWWLHHRKSRATLLAGVEAGGVRVEVDLVGLRQRVLSLDSPLIHNLHYLESLIIDMVEALEYRVVSLAVGRGCILLPDTLKKTAVLSICELEKKIFLVPEVRVEREASPVEIEEEIWIPPQHIILIGEKRERNIDEEKVLVERSYYPAPRRVPLSLREWENLKNKAVFEGCRYSFYVVPCSPY